MRDTPTPASLGGATALSVVHPGTGLRLRLWLGFLAMGGCGAAAVLGLFALASPDDPLFDPRAWGVWPWSAAFLCIVVAVGGALWLDHAIASHLRGLCRAIAGGDPSELGRLPATTGWGELSLLTAQLQSLIARHREMTRASVDLEELRHRLRALRAAVEARTAESLRVPEGPLALLVETLNRRRADDERQVAGNREDVLALRGGLVEALTDARASTEQAERGFVEATALLTTVRELQRLGGELQQALAAPSAAPARAATAPVPAAPAVPPAEAQRRYREAAAAAIQELVEASHESVERLAAGLAEVQEIGSQVQVLANRATLIALQVSLTAPRPAESAEGRAHDLRALAAEVRTVTDRTAEHLAILDREVAAASGRMAGLRGRVAARLEEAPPLPESAPAPASTPNGSAVPSETALRLLERVREMIQDAAAKGERLSATGERASRAADRVVRALDEEAGVLDELARRLGAVETPPAESGTSAGSVRPGDLRLLGSEEPGAESRPTRSPAPRVSPSSDAGGRRGTEESR